VQTVPFGRKGNWACGWHIGCDLVGCGSEMVYPIGEGTVIKAGKHQTYGYRVQIRHSNGYTSLYAHLKTVRVYSGQRVDANTPVGLQGATGNATGIHLHLEVHDGEYRYPDAGTTPADCPWLIDPQRLLG